MSNETLMMEPAPNTNDGLTTSQPADTKAAPADAVVGTTQQATEGQPAEGLKADGDKPAIDAVKADDKSVPDGYEFKAPEGKEFDPAVIRPFADVAKELGLSQDAAQKILDKMAPTIASRQIEAIEAARNEWTSASKADKEFGGDKLTENLSVAKRALDSFGTPELRTLLNQSGLGNHPEVIRFMYRAGKAVSEDGFVQGSRAVASQGDPARRLFPNQA